VKLGKHLFTQAQKKRAGAPKNPGPVRCTLLYASYT